MKNHLERIKKVLYCIVLYCIVKCSSMKFSKSYEYLILAVLDIWDQRVNTWLKKYLILAVLDIWDQRVNTWLKPKQVMRL